MRVALPFPLPCLCFLAAGGCWLAPASCKHYFKQQQSSPLLVNWLFPELLFLRIQWFTIQVFSHTDTVLACREGAGQQRRAHAPIGVKAVDARGSITHAQRRSAAGKPSQVKRTESKAMGGAGGGTITCNGADARNSLLSKHQMKLPAVSGRAVLHIQHQLCKRCQPNQIRSNHCVFLALRMSLSSSSSTTSSVLGGVMSPPSGPNACDCAC